MKATKILALLLCAVLMVGLMSACGKKVPQTAEGFAQIMETAGFEVYDPREEGEEYTLTEALYAQGENYRIEYFAYEDPTAAARVFNNQYNTLDEEFPTNRVSSRATTGSFQRCTFATADAFCVMVRIENTLVYCDTDAQYREEVLTHLEALGYR